LREFKNAVLIDVYPPHHPVHLMRHSRRYVRLRHVHLVHVQYRHLAGMQDFKGVQFLRVVGLVCSFP